MKTSVIRPRALASAFLAMVFMLTACSGGTENGAGGGPDSSATFRIVAASEPTALYPLDDPTRAHQIINRAFFDPLMTKTADFTQVTGDGLVTAVTQDSPTEFTLTIRDGVKFHNGEPLDGEAVAFSITYAATQTVQRPYYQVFASAVGDGATSAKVVMQSPTSVEFVSSLLTEIPAIPPKYMASAGIEKFSKEPVGTGPMVFGRWVPGQMITGTRNEDYWGGTPASAGFEATFNADGAARLAQVQAGDADFTLALDYSLVDNVGDGDGLEVSSEPGPNYLYVSFNVNNAPTDDPRIRRAIMQAIDSKTIADDLLGGHAEVQANFYGDDGTTGVGTEDPLPYDLDAAKALVEEVKAEKGELAPIQYDYMLGRYPAAKPIAEFIAQRLTNIGLDVKAPIGSGPNEFLPKFLGIDGMFDNMYTTVNANFFPGQDYYMDYKAVFGVGAVIPYCSRDFPEFGDLHKKWEKAGKDPVAKNEVEMKAQQLLEVEFACAKPLVRLQNTYVMRHVVGFEPRLDELLDWKTIGVTS